MTRRVYYSQEEYQNFLDESFLESKKIFDKISESKDIRGIFKLLIEKTKEKGIEHANFICQRGENISPSINACSSLDFIMLGEELTKLKCPKNSCAIGGFHTHTLGEHIPSDGDIKNALEEREKLTCIGSPVSNKVGCYFPYYKNFEDYKHDFGKTDYKSLGDFDISKDDIKSITIECPTQKMIISRIRDGKFAENIEIGSFEELEKLSKD